MNKTTKKGIKFSTIARLLVLAVVLVNQCLAIFGKGLPFTSDLVYQICSAVCTIIAAGWAAWKNNDITKGAIIAGKLFDSLKDGKITNEEAREMLESADAVLTAGDEGEEEEDEE